MTMSLVKSVSDITFALARSLPLDAPPVQLNTSAFSISAAKITSGNMGGKEIAYENKVAMKLPEDFSPRTKRDVHDENTPMLVKVFL